MKFKKRDGWMLAGGFALGTLGLKALSSSTAKKCYVQGVAKGLQAKAAYQDVVEQAKAPGGRHRCRGKLHQRGR